MALKATITGWRLGGVARVARRHLVVNTVLILGLLSIGMLLWTRRINDRRDEYFYLADTIMDLEILTAKAYLELDKAIRGNRPPDDEAMTDLNQAMALGNVLLNGGESGYGLVRSPIQDPQARAHVAGISKELDEMRSIAVRLSISPLHPEFSATWNNHAEDICIGVLGRAASLEAAVEKELAEVNESARRISYSILLTWAGLLLGATAGLTSSERKRRAAEGALLKVNSELECQTLELREHREHLAELVRTRTSDLEKANRELHREVVERRRTDRALRKSEEQYRRLVETMNEGLTIEDENGVLTFVNERFCAMMGASRYELLGHRSLEFLLSDEDRKRIEDQLKKLRWCDNIPYEVTFLRRDGRHVIARVSPKGIYDADGRQAGCFSVISDITERIELQEEAMRTAHLASLGEMAAGVAHEINNPANGIINYAQIILDETGELSPEHDIARRILTEGRRIAHIVRALLLFARGGRNEKIPARLSEVLSASLDLAGSQMAKDGIQVLNTVPAGLPEVLVDPQEIQQVLMNVVSNARYALNEKYPANHKDKTLRIHAETMTVDGSPYVRVAFLDCGVGIPAAIIDKIKEPFFSTKPRGRGTGLGLSISEGIINEHGGRLTIQSVEGEFTNVVIDLPATRREDGQNTCH